MSSYGFSFNTSAVKNGEDDKYSVGVNFKDSDGYHFEAEENGTLQEIADALYQKFLTQYLIESAKVKKEEEEAAKAEQSETAAKPAAKPAQADENLISRLRKLEQENARLRAENASAKYKDPNYNKPAVETKADSAVDSLDRATEIMKKRLKADQDSALKDMFAYEPFDFVNRFLGVKNGFIKDAEDFWKW